MCAAPAVTIYLKKWCYLFYCSARSAALNARSVIIILYIAGGWNSNPLHKEVHQSSIPILGWSSKARKNKERIHAPLP
jgi:hypothetical protein